jgi:hypothetical protein
MFTTLSVQLPTDTLLRLVERLKSRGGSQDMSEAITSAIESWLDGHSDGSHVQEGFGARGYQWKSLFLPEGTILRSWSYGEHNYARVEGDEIIHEGKSASPNQFARSFARTTRNAWFDLSVRRPGEKHFKMASLLRKELAAQTRSAPPAMVPVAATAEAPGAETAPSPRPAKPDFDRGRDLPERRRFRYRAEDIAF